MRILPYLLVLILPASRANAVTLPTADPLTGSEGLDITRLLLLIGALMLCSAMLGLWRYYKEHNRKLTPLGWIESQEHIRSILGNAVRHRSTFELQFPHRGVQRRPLLRCSPDDLVSSCLILEAQGIKNIARNWTDRLVNCYFKINVKGQHIYYAFSTKIQRVEIKSNGRCSLTLGLPKRMENRQKRAFLRIVPPPEYLMGAALWMGRHLPGPDEMPDMPNWPAPALVMLPGKREQFGISDLSGGGVRLVIPRKEMLRGGLELAVAEEAVLIVDLLNPDDRSRLRFWLRCRVQNFAAQYDTHNIETGLQFLAWASPTGTNSALEWHNIGRSLEVDALGNWIMRRHLELFRENPEAETQYPV